MFFMSSPSSCNRLLLSTYASPCGVLQLGAVAEHLCLCDWQQRRHAEAFVHRLSHRLRAEIEWGEADIHRQAARWLDLYFAGHIPSVSVPLRLVGTPFQLQVWHLLEHLPYGHTVNYGLLAERLSRPTAVRALAHAVGANPLSLFVPCHRVIGSDGSLVGYAGGLEAKSFLLNLEGAIC